MENLITILGAGESGTGAAILAKKKGYQVLVSDAKIIKREFKNILDENNIEYEENGHTERIFNTKLIIKSPGIPYSAEVIKTAQERGITVIDEIEFAFQNSKSKVIAITGTNGKTTTTLLIYHLLITAGIKAVLAGNVGKSFARAVAEHEPEYFVVELSSFQLEGVETFKPDIAILLNITPDHLDRYDGSMEKYAAAKMQIVRNMNDKDHFIFYDDDPQIRKNISMVPQDVQIKTISLHNEKSSAYYEDQQLILDKTSEFIILVEELALKGPHNYINSMCAAVVAKIIGIKKKKILQGLQTFKNAPHRLEKVGEIKGVSYVNDSKATNVQSVKYALDSFNEGLVWIAGGIDKGNDYALITELVKRKVKILICLGKENEKLKAAFQNIVDEVFETTNIQEAVEIAVKHADPGEVVLLSPACASFDLFLNYEDRGNQFKNAVKKIEQDIKA